MAVEPHVQGQGVGKAMMAQAIKLCRERGCYKMVISSNLKRPKAHAFYESLGFERHGYSFRLML
ncbi:MAG: GNAT family N-acetyltransferase [Nitrospira sp.]